MSEPKPPRPAKLITGLLHGPGDALKLALQAMTGEFGPLDHLSRAAPFGHTSYYEKEMGRGLVRRYASFQELVDPGRLAGIKLVTNRLEKEIAEDGRRRINIDPGLLSEERLVLATGKNYLHRVYLRDGIHADLTLIYEQDSYRALPWTYPDYCTPFAIHLFGFLRKRLLFQRGGRLPIR